MGETIFCESTVCEYFFLSFQHQPLSIFNHAQSGGCCPRRGCDRRQPDEASQLLPGQRDGPPSFQLHLLLHHQCSAAGCKRRKISSYDPSKSWLKVLIITWFKDESVYIFLIFSVQQRRRCLPGRQGHQERQAEGSNFGVCGWGTTRPSHGKALWSSRSSSLRWGTITLLKQRALFQPQSVRETVI